jgi:hypothetical protein
LRSAAATRDVPRGRYSEFDVTVPVKNKYSLCGEKLMMPALLKAQNGLQINQNTPITITGCKKLKARKATRHARSRKQN